ncbi:PBS lyase [Streptomyces sp. NPDC020875]|uniref:PBS lyase n=1 Tax=Streptomyces sp. NPDC020875 TaxID=3154898 RepID=UPI0033DF02C6
MFGGIDEVEWTGLEHAYGPAGDVPGLLRGLASADPEVRESALDGMYGAVHHQGDVYDSTLACIPFLLELVADPEVPDRGGVVELLTSIGGIELDGDDELDPEGEEFESAANYAMAASAVTAGSDVFLSLVDSEDRGVRLAVPLALAAFHQEPALVLALLRERLKVEQDPEVRFACVEAGGRIALRHDRLAGEVVEWLTALTHGPHDGKPSVYDPDAYRLGPSHRTARGPDGTGGTGEGGRGPVSNGVRGPLLGAPGGGRMPGRSYDPGLRLSAIAQLARCAPETLPADVVPGVTGLLRELRAARVTGPAGRAVPPQAQAGTAQQSAAGPAGRLREYRETDRVGRVAPWTGDLLRTLHAGLGDRVDDRIALLADQLCSPDWGQRIDAVRMSGGLMRTWRGDYDELVSLIGDQLDDEEPRLADAAVAALEDLHRLAEPAADALADYVRCGPDRWVRRWAEGPDALSRALVTLARTGDPRAVPVLLRLLEREHAPRDLGYAVGHLGAAAAPLVPVLRERLGAVPLDDRLYDHAGSLLWALKALRATEAMPEVLRVLRGAPAYRREWVVELVLRALTAFGPKAADAAPDLRALLADAARGDALPVAFGAKVAATLWAVEGDAEAVLPVLRGALMSRDQGARRVAAEAVGTMGRAASGAAPALVPLLSAADPWTRVDAAHALWAVTGDADRSWPVLRTAWESLPATRIATAELLSRSAAEPGAAAGDPDRPWPSGAAALLRSELSYVRRHNAIDGGYGSHDIVRDERLLALCRQALNGRNL